MKNKTEFCNSLINNILPPPHEAIRKIVSDCKSAAYPILLHKACASRSRFFCALLLGLMLGFSACSKYAKDPEPVEGPTIKVDTTAPNQGLPITIDTVWDGDTIIQF